MTLPASLKDLLTDDDALCALQDALSPPLGSRLQTRFEVELEAKGEGTFTLTFDDEALLGEKGMADDPFVSVEIPKGGYAFLKEILDAATAGFPDAKALAARQKTAKSLGRDAQEAAFQGLKKLEGSGLELDVTGVGVFRMARGSLDEVTRTLKATVPAALLRDTLKGAPIEALSGVKLGGDSRLSGDLMAALGPVWVKLKAAT